VSPYVQRIVERMHLAEAELAREVNAQRRHWHYRVRRGRVRFDREVRNAHRQFKQSIPTFIREGSFFNLLTAPFIYSLFLPFALLDLWVTLYQRVCFPIYGIPRVRRRAYFAIDRHRLAYLNGIEKINCTFCSYANGLIAYVGEVAARTEQFWCPIKHAHVIRGPHARYHVFFDYGDARAYRHGLVHLRKTLGRKPARGRRPQRPVTKGH
jgi:hypothetical protein